MDHAGHFNGQFPLGLTATRVLLVRLHLRLDVRPRQQREELEVGLDVAVVDVVPELVEFVRRGERRIEVDRARLRLSELRARGHGHEWRHESVRFPAFHPANEIDPRGDVAPLVTASHLDGAAPVAEQVQEVVRLQQHVAEFGVGNARVEPRFHRLLLQHDVHAEVLSHIAQEVDEGLLDEPIGVVEDEGLRRSVEVEEPRHLVALALQMLADLLLREQRPLAALAARIADQAGAAAHQHDGLVAGELEVPQQHDRHEIAELQAGCGRIEPAVHRAALRAEVRRDFLRGVVDETAPLELREEVRHGAESYEMPPPLASAERPY